MDRIENFKKRAASNLQRIVLPESGDSRILKATENIITQKLARVILLGNKEQLAEKLANKLVEDDYLTIIDNQSSSLLAEFTDKFYQLRKHKGIDTKQAANIVKQPLFFATMLVHTKRADGMVAGAENLTADVLRPAFQIIKTEENISTASGAFIMQLTNEQLGEDGCFLFADCAVNPSPDSQQLAEIAISSARTARRLLEVEPVVALLSFSTKGSASHQMVDKVREAVKIVKNKSPELLIDGELQLDAAIIPEVGNKKAPDSSVAGRANVLVFPDLQAGNIGYKLVERMAGASALGPILQGMARPINDLSRGCLVDDIINVVVVTSLQAQFIKDIQFSL